jgi:hypothetical protein
VEIHEFLLLKYDGTAEHFPIAHRDPGSVEQARLRASLSQHPGDCLVLVTEDAYIRLEPGASSEQPTAETMELAVS